ncbi:MAG: hypothetical protein RL136_59 [Planctomycetota bacterium]|jgi:hypothetical protein
MAHSNAIGTAAAAAVLSLGSIASAQDAVQWRVEDGGNGHWYTTNTSVMDWAVARDLAFAMGGHLATIHSAAENGFVLALALPAYGDYWLGGVQSGEFCGEACFVWITGEPWTFSAPWNPDDSWGCSNPNPNGCGWNGPGTGSVLELSARPNYFAGHWNDESPTLYFNGSIIGAYSIIEWSADCNGDGIVDFGQIRAGELADANGNNIPDCCEGSYPCGCPGDIVPDGVIDGVDLAAVLNQWGGPGDAEFSADTDANGVVDGGDLAVVLNGWGACR